MTEMKLEDLKLKSPTELLSFAEEVGVENPSTMRKQELMFATLKQLAAKDIEITGIGVVEVLQDGFGFLRSPDANYLPGPDDIYVSPSQIRRFALRTGDTVEVSVMDEGPGVPRGDEQRIFETFYRVASPGNPPGSGVGLAVCRGLVEAHGGRIRAEPAPGGGLIVRFTLPLDAGAMPGVAASERAGS